MRNVFAWIIFHNVRLSVPYYLSNLVGIISWPGPGGVTFFRTLMTLTVTNMWHWYDLQYPYANPAWTISTLAAFYIAFPKLLDRLHFTFQNNTFIVFSTVLNHCHRVISQSLVSCSSILSVFLIFFSWMLVRLSK